MRWPVGLLLGWLALGVAADSFDGAERYRLEAVERAGAPVNAPQAGDVLTLERIGDRPAWAFPLRPGAKIIYVDADGGDDGGDGLTPATAVRTLFAGAVLLEEGAGDHLLLERGDRWDGQYFPRWSVSGHSEEFPVVLGAYGEGGRPVIASGSRGGFEHRTSAVSYVAIVGLEFVGPDDVLAPRSSGISTLGPMLGFTIADCVIRQYAMNVSLQAFRGDPVEDVRVVDSVIADSIATRRRADGSVGLNHSSGLFAVGVEGLTIERCMILRNGWRPELGRSPLNHGAYINGDVAGVVVRDCIVMENSMNGIMARSGGAIEGNVLVGNGSNVFGSGRAEYPALSSGRLVGNLVVATQSVPPAWAWTVHEAEDLLIADNLFINADSTAANTRGLLLGLTLRFVTVMRNHVQGHGVALDLAGAEGEAVMVMGNTFFAGEGYVPVRGTGAGVVMGANAIGVAGDAPWALPEDLDGRARAQTITAAELVASARAAVLN